MKPVDVGEDSDAPKLHTPASESETQLELKQRIPQSAIKEGLHAIGSALRLSADQIHTIVKVIIENEDERVRGLSLEEWLRTERLVSLISPNHRHIINVAVALAFLRESGRNNVVVSPEDLQRVWDLINGALQCASLPWIVNRSAQCCHVIPLWSIVEGGCIQELFRLHLWLPDGERMDPGVAIHMHQPFAQGWILAGEGTDYVFDVVPAEEKNATHAEYTVSWQETADSESSRSYKTHASSSSITNTGKLVQAILRTSQLHKRNMSYHVPEGVYHKSVVEPDAAYATIFFFDSKRGYFHDAPIIGPILQKTLDPRSKSTDIKVHEIANRIEDLRTWELYQHIGLQHSERGEWEEALRAYRTALHVCQVNDWLDCPRYKHASLGQIGHKYRMLGRYRDACEILEDIVLKAPRTKFRVDYAGELAIVYRHMDRLEDSKRASEDQYLSAKEFGLEKFICRAAGTLGMVDYQLYLQKKDINLLNGAINLLNERIERAIMLGDVALEAIGHGRLSLCYMAKGEHEDAIHSAQRNYDLMRLQHDSTKIGFARVFLGRALLSAGRRGEALALFNDARTCPPIISLCKEISEEHRQYVVELINAGTDLKLRDEQGYSALECAVYNGDDETAKIIEQGLRVQISREGGDIEGQLSQFRYEAGLRKGYRDIFQDRLRPVFLGAAKDTTLKTLRQTYATALAEDSNKRSTFDGLKYVRYIDFVQNRQLPRSNGASVRQLTASEEGDADPFILFFSYRWIANDPGVERTGDSPDDAQHTQYNRMLRAIELFLLLHPEVDRKDLCIWVDFACVDQDNQRPGVAALPMNLAQCNAMISLVDDKYYERSWCCVEVVMIQTLKKAYNRHLWYEHVDPIDGTESLCAGPMDRAIRMAQKQVTYEEDRPKLEFLERQTRLLG